MYQRDYILRMIEEFFKFLRQILKLTSDKQYDEALALIDQTAQRFLKVELDDIVNHEDVRIDILENHVLSNDQLTILADLLKAKADIYRETNHIFSAISHYQLSLDLYEQVQKESTNFSLDIANKMDDLKLLILNISV